MIKVILNNEFHTPVTYPDATWADVTETGVLVITAPDTEAPEVAPEPESDPNPYMSPYARSMEARRRKPTPQPPVRVVAVHAAGTWSYARSDEETADA